MRWFHASSAGYAAFFARLSRLCCSPLPRSPCGALMPRFAQAARFKLKPQSGFAAPAPHVHAPLLSEATAWEGTGKREEVDGCGAEVLLGYQTLSDLGLRSEPGKPP